MEERWEWVEIIEPRTREHMYANLTTGECVWDPPPGVRIKKTDSQQWWELFDQNTQRFYYYNASTQKTVWHRPQNADIIPLAKLQTLKQNTEVRDGELGRRGGSVKREMSTQTPDRPQRRDHGRGGLAGGKLVGQSLATQTARDAKPHRHHHHHGHHRGDHHCRQHDPSPSPSTSSSSSQLAGATPGDHERNHLMMRRTASTSSAAPHPPTRVESPRLVRAHLGRKGSLDIAAELESPSRHHHHHHGGSLRPMESPSPFEASYGLATTIGYPSEGASPSPVPQRPKRFPRTNPHLRKASTASQSPAGSGALQSPGGSSQAGTVVASQSSVSMSATLPGPHDLACSRVQSYDSGIQTAAGSMQASQTSCLSDLSGRRGSPDTRHRRLEDRSSSQGSLSSSGTPTPSRGVQDGSPSRFQSRKRPQALDLMSQSVSVSRGDNTASSGGVSSSSSHPSHLAAGPSPPSAPPHGCAEVNDNRRNEALLAGAIVAPPPPGSLASTPTSSVAAALPVPESKAQVPGPELVAPPGVVTLAARHEEAMSVSAATDESAGSLARQPRPPPQMVSSAAGTAGGEGGGREEVETGSEVELRQRPQQQQQLSASASDEGSTSEQLFEESVESDEPFSTPSPKMLSRVADSYLTPSVENTDLAPSRGRILGGGEQGGSHPALQLLLQRPNSMVERNTDSPVPKEAHAKSQSLHRQPNVEGFIELLNLSKKGLFGRKESTSEILSWQKEPIKKPMITTQDKAIKKESVEVFKLIQQYMGDRGRGGKEGDPAVVLEVTSRGWTAPLLRDEIFLQICKQTTDNRREESLERGWELMAVCLAFFPPSPRFHAYLEGYIYRNATELRFGDDPARPDPSNRYNVGQVDVTSYAKFCMKRLERVAQTGAKRGQRRPTPDEIQAAKKNIFWPSMFGNTLEDVMALQQARFPDRRLPWVQTTLSELVLRLHGARTEGIFRVPGDIDEVNGAKLRCDTWETLERCTDPHVPASLLKLWYRELYMPLIPQTYYQECVEAYEEPDRAVEIVSRLPDINRLVLCYLVRFLQVFAAEQNKVVTKMDESNLAMVMAPNCLRCESDNPIVIFDNTRKEMGFIRTLLIHLDTSFMEGVI